MCCGYRHLNVDHSSKFVDGKVHINGLEGFWSWAKERLFKHHGISPQKFPLYLKELEFRYNHREESIFEQLVEFLSDFVPELPREPLGSASQREFKHRVLIFMKIVLVQIWDNYQKKCRSKPAFFMLCTIVLHTIYLLI